MQAGAIALPDRNAARAALAASLAVLLSLASLPAAAALGDLVRVVVVAGSADEAAALVSGAGGTVHHRLAIVDGASGELPSSALASIRRRAQVFEDRAIGVQSASFGGDLANVYPDEVGATSLREEGVTGEGVAVALVDTGVTAVPDLAGRIVASANLTDEGTNEDTYGHGTFQAGLIAGTGASSGGAVTGVAPGADLVSVKVAGADGSTSLAQVLAAVQLVDDAAERYGIGVLLLALDSESPLPPDLDPLSWALRTVWSHGVVVVVPAGNDGPDAGTIASPGEDPWLLTAGSVDDLGTPTPDDDVPADSTARGPTRWGDDKPDLAAPGEHLISTRAPGSTIDREHPDARRGEAYFRGSGTSMAAAVTAGAAALVRSARPDLSPDEVKALLMATATAIEAGEAVSTGAGVVSAAEAARFDGELPDLPDAPSLRGPKLPGFLKGVWLERDGGEARPGKRAARWNARRWDARRWDARRWDDDWAARQWRARQWRATDWAARQWRARQWRGDDWAARQWRSDEWAARQWRARQWRADDWSARQWRARQWDARQWDARRWNAGGWG